MKSLVVAAAAVLASAAGVSAAITAGETARLTAAARIVQEIRSDIPQQYWDRAHCVAVIPDLKKAAFIVGGEYGKGVMSCRAGDRWSAPVFMQLAKGSWGFQAGAEQVDVVLLVMNEQGVQKLLQNKVNLGADASVAAGPIGRQGQVGTDANLTAEILSYSRAKGLFAGIDLSGGVLRPDEDANRNTYGSTATPRTILASREISAPTQAAPFLNALASVSSTTAAPAPPAPAQSSTASTTSAPAATSSTGDADARAAIADMQRTLDRLLADAGRAPVGTTGTTEPIVRTVTVDRTTLEQLRRQLDAISAALDRRR
jgi:lipid-binding SYLF domain-containing protein